MKLTETQKLEAMALRFYQGLEWVPEAGHLYTTSRADLEVYEVVKVEGGKVFTRYTEGETTEVSEWPIADFLTADFGLKRVWIPPFVLSN
jgi:hypothetical protein